MNIIEEIREKELRVTAIDEGDRIRVLWRGSSKDRNPSIYLNPFFERLLLFAKRSEKTTQSKKSIELDFTRLYYMNSSSITPVVRLLHRARDLGRPVTLFYDRSHHWQETCFSAMDVFESKEPEIRIVSV